MNLFVNICIICLSFFSNTIYCQDWEIAPEIWSEPVLLDSAFDKSYNWTESPSLTANLDTIYFFRNRVLMSTKKDNVWSIPTQLTDNINGFSAVQECSISKNGKRLYFSAWGGYGNWDLFYSNWDDSLKNWLPAKNMGYSINSFSDDDYLFEICKDSIFVIQNSRHLNLYEFNNTNKIWVKVDSFWYHPLGEPTMYGLSLTNDRKKMYFGRYRYSSEWALDLCVCYWDEKLNYWGNVYYLNINTKKVPWNNMSKRGGEYFPWISPDGKILIFSSNKDAPLDLDSSDNSSSFYISYLLVDENGDSLTSLINNDLKIPISFELKQNYPNPISSTITTIEYSVPKSSNVKIVLYNTLGESIKILKDSYHIEGKYKIYFEGNKLSSGIYFYSLIADHIFITKKIIVLK